LFDFRDTERRLKPSADRDQRLSPGLSTLVIAALSGLAWIAQIALVVAVRDFF
jgi:hypothetical protein